MRQHPATTPRRQSTADIDSLHVLDPVDKDPLTKSSIEQPTGEEGPRGPALSIRIDIGVLDSGLRVAKAISRPAIGSRTIPVYLEKQDTRPSSGDVWIYS